MATSNQFLSYLLNILNTVTYTGIELRVFQLLQSPCKVICPEIAAQALSQRSCYTGVATQELLHRSAPKFQVMKLYPNSCEILLLQSFYSSLVVGSARLWFSKFDSTACQATKVVAATLAEIACGLVKWEISLPPANVFRDHACRAPKHVVDCDFFGAMDGSGKILQRSQQVRCPNMGECKFCQARFPAPPLPPKSC